MSSAICLNLGQSKILFSSNGFTLNSIDTCFNASITDVVVKEEIAHNKQFVLFPQCFLLNHKIVSPFVNIFDIISLFAAELEESKFGI